MPRLLLLVAGLLLARSVFAASGFERQGDGVRRSAFGVYGGRVADLAIDADGTLYAAARSPNGIFCSHDGALTWAPPPLGSDFGTALAVEIGDAPGTAYVATDSGLYRTTDGCASYTRLAGTTAGDVFGPGMAFAHGTLLAAVALADGAVAIERSTDGGASFTAGRIGESVLEVLSLAASPARDVFWAVLRTAGTNVLALSATGGRTWGGIPRVGAFTRVAVNPLDAREVVLAGGGLVQRSTNGGASFVDVTPAGGVADDDAARFAGGRLWIGARWTADGGVTWHAAGVTAAHDTDLVGPVVAHPTLANTYYVGSRRGVARSADGLATCTDAVDGMLGVAVGGIARAPGDRDVVYLAARGGVARTRDALAGPAASWTYPIDVSGEGADATAVAVLDDAGDVVLASAAGGIFRSSDGGVSWGRVGDGAVSRFARATDGVLFGGLGDAGGGIVRSDDDGATWSDGGFPVPASVNALAVGDGVVYAGVGSEADGDPARRGVWGFAAGSWRQLLAGPLVRDVAVGGTTLLAAANDAQTGGLLRSTDGGATWSAAGPEVLEQRCARAVAADAGDPARVFAATACAGGPSRLWESHDGGASWRLRHTGLRDEVPAALSADGPLVGQNTGAYAITDLCTLRQPARDVLEATFADGRAGMTATFEARRPSQVRYRTLPRPEPMDAAGVVRQRIPRALRRRSMLFRATGAGCTTLERAWEKSPAPH